MNDGFPGDLAIKSPQCRRRRRLRFDPWVGKIPWRRKWLPTPVSLPGESDGQRSLATTVHGVTNSRTWLKQLSMQMWMTQTLWGKEDKPVVFLKTKQEGIHWNHRRVRTRAPSVFLISTLTNHHKNSWHLYHASHIQLLLQKLYIY